MNTAATTSKPRGNGTCAFTRSQNPLPRGSTKREKVSNAAHDNGLGPQQRAQVSNGGRRGKACGRAGPTASVLKHGSIPHAVGDTLGGAWEGVERCSARNGKLVGGGGVLSQGQGQAGQDGDGFRACF